MTSSFRILQYLFIVLSACLGIGHSAYALTFTLPPAGEDMIGNVYTITAQRNDNFDAIAERYNVGFYELIEANPKLSPDYVREGTEVTIPARYLLPSVRKGLVINVAEMRAYYFPAGKNIVYTYPIGVGRQGENTPTGRYYILEKMKHPAWHAPPSVRRDYLARGITLPAVVPPGEANPLGNYAMRLDTWSNLIHGTNMPSSVGKRSSAGCVHLYPADIEHLFGLIDVKTPVYIVDQNFKLGWHGKKLFLEAEKPLLEKQQQVKVERPALLATAVKKFLGDKHANIDWAKANQVAVEETGVPVQIN